MLDDCLKTAVADRPIFLPNQGGGVGLGLRLLTASAAVLLSGCGAGSTTAPTPPGATSSVTDMFSVNAEGARFHPMHRAAFGPIYGSGCPNFGDCGCGASRELGAEFNCQLDRLASHDIPITAYLFDGSAWSRAGSDARNTCVGPDCCVWDLGDQVIERLARDGVRGLVHFWGGCHGEEQYRRVATRLGGNLLGFYLDDGSSDADLIEVDQFMEQVRPGDWEVVAKAFQNREPATTPEGLSRWANAAYVGDLPVGFDGLKEAVTRVLQQAPRVPAPLAELTGYDYLVDVIPEEAVYHRRLHFGALQPVMAHTPYANSDPWRSDYRPELVNAYRYWAWLHRELVPLFYSLAYRMHEDPSQPVLKPGPMPDSLLIGDVIYAPIVTAPVLEMDVELPPGRWVDYWDETHVASGRLVAHKVPLGREPIFVRAGAMLPLNVERDYTGHGSRESAGSLTLLVYPGEASSLRYRHGPRAPWITFSASRVDQRLTLIADPELPGPVIYRIADWNGPPESAEAVGVTVAVNQGGEMEQVDTEAEASASPRSAWYYDAGARRLVIKAVP